MSTVLITGAASGLGWALAQQLHARGDRLLLVDRDAALLAQRVTALGAARVKTVVADLASDEGIATTIATANDEVGELDVLINNAGITHRSLAASTRPAVLKRVMAVGWQAPVELALGLLPLLHARRGSIVNIGSMAGWMPVLGRAGYCSAKAALGQFFEVLRAEEQDSGLHVLMVYPSFLDTPIEKNALGGDGGSAAHARSTIGTIRSADDFARDIVTALDRRAPVLYSHRSAWLASLLWRLAPRTYHALMRRKFAVELEQR